MRGRREPLYRKRERTGEGAWPAPGFMSEQVQQEKLQTDDDASILQRLSPDEAQFLCLSNKAPHRAGLLPCL